MSLQGLPDFQLPLQVDNLQILYPYEGAGNHILLPEGLEIAKRPNGRPDFTLEFVRGKIPFLPPKPYGLLDFRVRPVYRMEEGLTALRQHHLNAQLASGSVLSSGFLRLGIVAELSDLPEELLNPIPLAWNGLGIARFTRRLSEASATVLKQSLEGGLLTLQAVAEVEMIGVSPRIPVRVHFDPAELLSALWSLGNSQGQVAREAITQYFLRDPQLLPLTIAGEPNVGQQREFAEALTDWVRVRFGTFIPSPERDGTPHILLPSLAEIGRGRFEWDLSRPIQVPRPLLLTLNPFDAAQQLVQDEGVDAVITKTTVPPIPAGFQRISVVTNLPENRQGIWDLGVTVRVEPQLPFRPQAQVKTVSLREDPSIFDVDLRFSPVEKPEYNVFTYTVVRDAGGIEQIKGEIETHQGNVVFLRPDDFPVDFVPIEASQSLLRLATIQGILRRPDGDTEVEQTFKLTSGQPMATLALPKQTVGASLEFEAISLDGLGTVKIDPLPARPLQLSLSTFNEYGPQKVEVTCLFQSSQEYVVFEFLPEDRTETHDEIKRLYFRPSDPEQTLSWYAASLFQHHYRYRARPSQSDPSPPWSDYLSPDESLTIQV
ncbi:MAG: hypothetical protein AAF702_41885 [Chloroflexota bacterium]